MIPFAIGTGARNGEQLNPQGSVIIFDKTKSSRPRFVEMNSEVRAFYYPSAKANDLMIMFGLVQRPTSHSMHIKKGFISACEDAGIEGLVWHDLRATYRTRLVEAGFNAYEIAKLMGHANISTSQRYVRLAQVRQSC